MIRRSLVIALFVLVVCMLAAAPALAYGPAASFAVDPFARMAEGAIQPTYVWAEAGALKTARVVNGVVEGPHTVVSGIVALGDWYVSGDGHDVHVLWKDGSSVYVAAADVSTGAVLYGPTLVCADARAIELRGTGATVAPGGIVADGAGGAYVWCTLSPTSTAQGVGDSVVDHVTAGGALARPAATAQAESGGTVAGMAAVGAGDVLALLTSPGRSQVAARRYATDLSSEWTRSPYLIPPTSVASSEGIAVIGGSTAGVAWREGGSVKVQRFTETGDPKFLSPPAVAMAGAVAVAADGSGGFYVVGPSGGGLAARHVLVSGLEASWDPSTIADVGAVPVVYGLAANDAGDLFVASGDDLGGAVHGISLLTYTGSWSWVGPASAPEMYRGVVPDGTGGAWALGGAGNARLWHIAATDPQLTFRPRSRLVAYGKTAAVAGYDTVAGGAPVAGATVRIHPASGPGAAVTATTDAAGLYRATIRPKANATWTATAGGVDGDQVTIQVQPKVTMTMSHLKAGTRLSETFSGAVSPNHKGKKVLIQRAAGAGWKTVAAGRLDSRSRYAITWYVPYKTATYKLRAVSPAHGDHAQGTSPVGTLRVVIRKG